ncbi:PHP domain-containing protein [Verrucomicrobiota bacterium]
MTTVFDSDQWVESGQHLSAIKSAAESTKNSELDTDQILLVVGSKAHSDLAAQHFETERQNGGKEFIVYQPKMMPSAVTDKPVLDLHCHTHYSDGTATPMEVIEEAATLGLEALSVTDHDSLDAYILEPEIFKRAESLGVALVPGVEVGCLDWSPVWKEYGGRINFHVLLYFPGLPGESREQHLARLTAVNDRLLPRRYYWPLVVTHLLFAMKRDYPKADITMRGFLNWVNELNRKDGKPCCDVSWADTCPCEDFGFWEKSLITEMLPGGMPARFHDNKVILYTMEQIREIYELPSGVNDVYQFFRYVHMNPDHYLGRPKDFPDWYAFETEQAVALAHEFTGLAVCAHPLEGPRALGADAIVGRIRAIGFDGVETYNTLQCGAACLLLSALRGVQTGGSDCHGELHPDIKLGSGRQGHVGMQTTYEMMQSLVDAGMLAPSVMEGITWTPVPSVEGV